jgi:hypothetical protein
MRRRWKEGRERKVKRKQGESEGAEEGRSKMVEEGILIDERKDEE